MVRVGAGMLVRACLAGALIAGLPSALRPQQPVAARSAGGVGAASCVPKADTLQDSVYLVLAARARQTGIVPKELEPALQAIAWRAHLTGVGRIGLTGVPGPGLLDLRTGPEARTLPAEFATVPGEYAFTLQRDGSVTGVRVVTAAGVRRLDSALTMGFVRVDSAPPDPFASSGGPVFPQSVAADSVPLRIRFSVGRDSTGANRLFAIREIALVHIDQQPVPFPENPRPVYPAGHHSKTDTVLVQFGVSADGRVDMPSVRPIRAWAQPFVDAVMAVLPRLRFTPALAGGCPVRTVLLEPFVLKP